VGAEQRLATVVAIGLVLTATVVMVYLFNEPNRRVNAEEAKVEESAMRGVDHYIQFCLQCHGEDGMATGRTGVPLNIPQNQTDDPILWEQREEVIRRTIERGRGEIMPAWAQTEGGPLNSEQILDLVNLIHLGLWDEVEHGVLDRYGAIPTPPPLPTPAGPVITDPLALQGQELYVSAGCAACHTVDGRDSTGPTWQGLWMNEVPLDTGETVVADEEYIRESILLPNAKIHEGYPPVMPSYEGRLTDEEIDAIIAYIQALDEEQ
jgi:mono/diheme cytochrome c family protein